MAADSGIHDSSSIVKFLNTDFGIIVFIYCGSQLTDIDSRNLTHSSTGQLKKTEGLSNRGNQQ